MLGKNKRSPVSVINADALVRGDARGDQKPETFVLPLITSSVNAWPNDHLNQVELISENIGFPEYFMRMEKHAAAKSMLTPFLIIIII